MADDLERAARRYPATTASWAAERAGSAPGAQGTSAPAAGAAPSPAQAAAGDPSARAGRRYANTLQQPAAGGASLPTAEAPEIPPELAKRYPNTLRGPIELEAPEGFDKEAPAFKEFLQLAGAGGLDRERASKLLGLYQREVQQRDEQRSREVAGWREQIQKDPELTGGQKDAEDLVRKFGGAELVNALGDTADHPVVARFLVRVAKALGGTSGRGRSGGGGGGGGGGS